MDINELLNQINKQREKSGLFPLSKEEYLKKISEMQVKGYIEVENGEVKPVRERK